MWDKQWANKLSQLWSLERVHLFIEVVAYGQRDFIIHANRGTNIDILLCEQVARFHFQTRLRAKAVNILLI